MLPRFHLFEWNDTAASPRWVRESIVEILGRGLRWGRIYVPVAPLFAKFLERTGASAVLDLASGSGEPCAILLEALERGGHASPRFVVSDLFPNEAALRAVAARHPGKIEVVARSVDATSVPSDVDQPARTIITAFHHLAPDLARKILADCVQKERAIFIVEAFPRRVARMLSVLPFMTVAAFANPFLAERDRLVKVLFTWLIPLLPLMGLWDAFVSVLRIHSEEEMRRFVEPLGDGHEWEYHEVPFFPLGRASVFLGVPRRGSRPEA